MPIGERVKSTQSGRSLALAATPAHAPSGPLI
jgi:hypothetical protein